MKIYGKLGTQPAFFILKRQKFWVGKKISFQTIKRGSVWNGIVINLEPFRADYI